MRRQHVAVMFTVLQMRISVRFLFASSEMDRDLAVNFTMLMFHDVYVYVWIVDFYMFEGSLYNTVQ